MVTAMAYPEATKYKRGGSPNSSKNEELSKISSGNLSMARYVLRNNFTPEAKRTAAFLGIQPKAKPAKRKTK